MGSHHEGSEHREQRHTVRRVFRLVTVALTIAAVVKEIRTPADERTWNGIVAGFVPYDFRAPTVARFRERMWNPESTHLVNPRVFGVGWTVNAGKLVGLVREKVAASS